MYSIYIYIHITNSSSHVIVVLEYKTIGYWIVPDTRVLGGPILQFAAYCWDPRNALID